MSSVVAKEPFSLSKLRRWLSMKMEHGLRRRMYLRKPLVCLLRPSAYMQRRRTVSGWTLGRAEQDALQALGHSGCAPVDAVVDKPLIFALAEETNRRREAHRPPPARISSRKTFWESLLRDEDLRSDSPFVRAALQKPVLRIIGQYLGQTPYLTSLELVQSRADEGGWKVSQLWHRDFNDARMAKLFVYLSDVATTAQGPFTYIPGNVCDRPRDPLFPIHKSDQLMERLGGVSHHQEILGAAGTSFLIDTARCYHKGSRILDGGSRLAYIATYTTFATYQPYDNRIEVVGPLDELERQTLRI